MTTNERDELAEFIAGITPENRHGEVDFGRPGRPQLTEQEIAQCRRAAGNALASQRLESLEPDPSGDLIEAYLERVRRTRRARAESPRFHYVKSA